jgi:hypothetical protein
MAKKIDFNKEVEDLDIKWSDLAITADATDVFESLVAKHGESYMTDIKKAVEEFYQITL